MPDDIDRAQAANEQFQADALQEHRRQQHAGPGSDTCIDCREPIPDARRRAHPAATRCLSCQTELETNSRRFM